MHGVLLLPSLKKQRELIQGPIITKLSILLALYEINLQTLISAESDDSEQISKREANPVKSGHLGKYTFSL